MSYCSWSSILLSLLLLLCNSNTIVVAEYQEDGFFKDCPPSRCSTNGAEVRFPLRLESSPDYCGYPGLSLACSGNDTVLAIPALGSYNVTAIDYSNGTLTVANTSWASCRFGHLMSFNLTGTMYDLFSNYCWVTLLNCSSMLSSKDAGGAAPIPCLTGGGNYVYAANATQGMDKQPVDCTAILSTNLPAYLQSNPSLFRDKVDLFERRSDITLTWVKYNYDTYVPQSCLNCETGRGRCGWSWADNSTICLSGHHGPKTGLIIGVSIGAFMILLITIAALVFFYFYAKYGNQREAYLKVERFLATYKETKPTRFTFSEIKKISRRFRQKLGQGGFGSVYKGELTNGIPVAVKMLENSRGDGEEFINEVATIGRIHHFNVVRLLGFCSEGTRRALVYEFLPNESLEKFIFPMEFNKVKQPFSSEKLLEIALGIAKGIEYLHQGCIQRILHFDIKPHNILLDHGFNPKISDFGLAKLCSRDQSIVTMTAARGTMGYIAPEIYSRNFGTVSYKSDVYSFGMLLLEMLSGRRNISPEIGNEGGFYFPEWIYDQLVQGGNLGEAMEMDFDEEIMKKIAIVGLWCIQWSPADRPTMSKAVNMLQGNLESLQMPPKPFVSSHDQVSHNAPSDLVS